VRIKISDAESSSGFDRLIVVGLSSQGPFLGAARLEALFDAHHYTDGLAFVPQGTATNNTAEAPSGYRDRDPGFDRSFAVDRQAPLALSDGLAAASTLGIAPATFEHIEHADRTDQRNARAMAVAAWPATLGYFLSQMMADVYTPEQVEQARGYFRPMESCRSPLSLARKISNRILYGRDSIGSSPRWCPCGRGRRSAHRRPSGATTRNRAW